MLTVRSLAIGVVVSLVSSFARAQCPWLPAPTVVTPGGPTLELFGYPVAISGDDAAVGAPADPTTPGGAVYWLRRSGGVWSVAGKIAPSSPIAGTAFGAALALQGDRLVVGAPYENAKGFHTGAAYVFERSGSTWTQRAHLVASNAFRRDYFGCAVALDGSTTLIGAYGATELGVHYNGAAYVFEESGGVFTETQRLLPVPGGERGLFGRAVALRGPVAVVGAPFEDVVASDAGAAYVFTRSASTWTLAAKLLPSVAEIDAAFGAAVDLTSSRVFVGASRYDDAKQHFGFGAVEVFRDMGGTWSFETALQPADGALGDYFGFALAARGNTLLVGAHGNAQHGFESGAAYEFEFANGAWHERQKLVASDATVGARFGLSVALGMDAALVGAPLAAHGATAPGATYAFERAASVVDYGTSCAGSSGGAPSLSIVGCPTPGSTIVLRVSRGVPGEPVNVLVGRVRTDVTLPGGCNQLVGSVMKTLALPPIDAQGASMGSLTLPLGAQSLTLTLQALVGDATQSPAIATTNGVELGVP